MVPMVSTAEKAATCMRAMRYPPHGDRGLAGMVRAHDYGIHREMRQPVFYAQIKTIEGVENARTIAAVNGVDVLFIGPMDLKLQLQSYPERARLDFAELQALGFTHLAIETDITLLREIYRSVIHPFAQRKHESESTDGVIRPVSRLRPGAGRE